MPIQIGKDNIVKKFYVRFGTHGKKYYFDERRIESYNDAYNKALKQSKAIHYFKNHKSK